MQLQYMTLHADSQNSLHTYYVRKVGKQPWKWANKLLLVSNKTTAKLHLWKLFTILLQKICNILHQFANRCMQRTKGYVMDAYIHTYMLNEHRENLCECASFIREYEAYLAEFFVKSDGAWLSSDRAITTQCSHVHVAADVMTVPQSH